MAAIPQAFTMGQWVTLSVAGSFQTVTNSPATFEEKFRLNLIAMGFDTPSIDLTVKGGLDKLIGGDWISEPYTAIVKVRLGVPSITRANLTGYVVAAAEKAGSYTPGVSVVSAGESSQPDLKQEAGLLGDLLAGLGSLAKAPGNILEEVPGFSYTLVIGIVIIVGLIAFGPNLKGVGGRL